MDFKTVVKALCTGSNHDDIADALNASYYSVKQALLPCESAGYRSPPQGWEKGLAGHARKRAAEMMQLAEQLDRVSHD